MPNRALQVSPANKEGDQTHRQRLTWLATSEEPVVAVRWHYTGGTHIPPHSHERHAQFAHVIEGVVMMQTDAGRWMVPPGHAIWIPHGLVHWLDMLGDVSLHLIYVAGSEAPTENAGIRVMGMSALMGALLPEAVEANAAGRKTSRDRHLLALVVEEIPHLPTRAMSLPFPSDPRLVRLCQDFLENPSPHSSIDAWAERLGMSRRSFTRLFHRETGTSLALWRQQACLLTALPRLADGVPVTTIALDLGYDSAPAFTTMFKRLLGASPSLYKASHSYCDQTPRARLWRSAPSAASVRPQS